MIDGLRDHYSLATTGGYMIDRLRDHYSLATIGGLYDRRTT